MTDPTPADLEAAREWLSGWFPKGPEGVQGRFLEDLARFRAAARAEGLEEAVEGERGRVNCLGFEVVTDPSMPPATYSFRVAGREVARIVPGDDRALAREEEPE
jgi:hypothetical protein